MAPLARAVWAKMSVTPELSEPAVGDLFMAGEGTFQAGEGWGRESFLLAVDSLAHCHPLPPTPAFQGCSRRGPGGEGSPLGTPGTSTSLGPFLHRKLLKIVFYNDGGSKLNITLAIFIYFLPLILKDIRNIFVDPLASVMGFPGGLVVKESSCNAGALKDAGSIPGWGRSPGGGHGNPLQHSCLENPVDRGAWWATVHGVIMSWTRLSN